MMINLNVRSGYDFLSSAIRLDDLIEKVSRDNQAAVAITDRNRLHGVYSFIKLARKHNVVPIVGMEVAVSDGDATNTIITYAKNDAGFRALIRISAYFTFKQTETIPAETLSTMIDECLVVFLSEESLTLKSMLHIPRDDMYQSHLMNEPDLTQLFIKPSYYLNAEDASVLTVIEAIRDNTRVDAHDLVHTDGDYYVRLMNDLTEQERSVLNNHRELVEKCLVNLPHVERTLPTFKHNTNLSAKDYLWQLLTTALPDKTPATQAYQERLKYEYDVICNMSYEAYFLIVHDAVSFAKRSGILVGPGRGSSSASLVAFLLNITEVDPLKYDLVFERFLNPERVTMPDIDIDFDDVRRNEVIDYLIDTYGEMHVAHIANVSRLSLRAATRAVGRVLDFSTEELNYISSILKSSNDSLDAFNSKAFQDLRVVDEKYIVLEQLVQKIINLPNHTVIHASGVLISDAPINKSIPVTFEYDGSRRFLMSQWPMEQVEAVGLLKVDILIIKTLTHIKYMVQNIQRVNPSFQLSDIDIESHDPRIFNLLSSGLTTGIFQFESQGIKEALRRVKPSNFNELVAMVSLYRPGPMESIPAFIEGKRNPKSIKYLHPDLEQILKSTYGVIIYQEQIMQIVVSFGGFTYGEADILRRAMSKKNHDALSSMRSKFIAGALNKGYDQSVAEEIYNYIQKFESYGFVKSHAVAYSKISYWMIYIKLYYRHIFFQTMLMDNRSDTTKLNDLVKEMDVYKIKVEPPCINQSQVFNTSHENIRLGLAFIKGVNVELAKRIVTERKEKGAFKDLFELNSRIDDKSLNKNAIQALIKSGALDSFGYSRKQLLQMVSGVSVADENYAHQSVLSEMGFHFKAEHIEEMPVLDKLNFEKEVLGFFISDHPIIEERKALEFARPARLTDKEKVGDYLVYLTDIRKIKTKRSQDMAFLTVSDGQIEMDAVIFPSTYGDVFHLIKEQTVVANGAIKKRDGKDQLVINNLMTIDEYTDFKIKNTKLIYIRNISQYNVINQLDSMGIPVIDFEKKTPLGYVKREHIPILLDAISHVDIRLTE